jgi:hypothetical protein
MAEAGYHLSEIPKGEYGELSKIEEELFELKDAISQGNKIMSLVELSDMLCAIEGYLDREYEGKITMTDLARMAEATRRAFKSGARK